MAINKEVWDKARILFEHGKSLNDIAKELGINKGSISRKSKQEEWAKSSDLATLVDDEVANIIKGNEIATQKATLATQELRIHNREVADKVRRKDLVFGNAEKLAKKLNTMTDQVDEPQDLKHLVDANDKLSITLRVNERHAPKSDTNVAVQTNNNLTKAEISKSIADSLPD